MAGGPSSPCITRAGEYALRALVRLAERDGAPVTARELAATIQAPAAYLTRVLRPFIHAGILAAKRGAGGGFRMIRDPHEVTLLEALTIVGGCTALHGDEMPGDGAPPFAHAIQRVMHRADDASLAVLASATLADVAEPGRLGGFTGAIAPVRVER
ncbi:MAG: RrF2 family transcriptional regulator [Phycisphaerales bacterium]